MPKLSFYVHVGNPGKSLARHWPKTGLTPYGACENATIPACSYQYGENLANEDLKRLRSAHIGHSLLFIDVEREYSWQNDTRNNVAALEGMTATFKHAGNLVGIYSNSETWNTITAEAISGTSNLNGLPDWVLGAHSTQEAQDNCHSSRFTGIVILSQIATGNAAEIDKNIVCPNQ